MQDADKGADLALNGQDLRIGIVQARFNEPITNALARACLTELEALGELVRQRVRETSGHDLQWEVIRVGQP